MTKRKLTEWYPSTVKPVRNGVYEVFDGYADKIKWYSYWNGKKFGYFSSNIDFAYIDSKYPTSAIVQKWRGIAK